ncbi:MAG: hypothetical protein FVQ85_11555 [Planctomycetes bacterium]|nr:hypothetical protein [Planctomycetota bacterium]
MKLGAKTALGIDISDGRINLALLKKSRNGVNGVELLKTASGPVPNGAIKNGNIEDAIVLAKAIKELKTGNKIHARHAALSLIANPVLMQILDIPKNMPGNIRQFVCNEVKHCAILPIKEVAIDFCGINSSGKPGDHRAFVVATDSQKITEAVKVLNQAGLNIDAIEPASVAYIRACHAKKIAQQFDKNLLFAIVNEGVLTLCLFRNQALSFVRTKRLEADKYFEWLIEEINAVIRFYDLEAPETLVKWEVTLVTSICDKSVFEDKIESLGNKNEGVELEVRTLENAYLDTLVADTELRDKPSAFAVGLAMKLLDFPSCGLNINLLPPETEEAKSTNKKTLIIAYIAAAILFLMISSVGFFSMKVKSLNDSIAQKQPTQLRRNTRALLDEQVLLDEQITSMSGNLNRINAILSTGTLLKWDQILNDIGRTMPKAARITELSSDDNSKMVLKGQSLSYEAVHLFVGTLNTCKNIKSASLIEAQKGGESGALISYSISCSLIQ